MERQLITGSKVGITIAAMAAALMAILDISIVNVAISDIRASFGTPIDQIAWVSTGYMMANVVIIPITGWMQRRYGFRRYLTASIFMFIVSSALCGVAWNLWSLVAFRVLQGMGGGAIIPTAQSILFARYPREEHGMAGALFGLGAVTGPLLGPTLGGYLIEIAGWPWIFLINVPIGFFAMYMAWKHIEEPDFKPNEDPIDKHGFVLLMFGMASLQYLLEEGNRDGWFDSLQIAILACIAAVCLITFVVHELECEFPIVDLRIFKDGSYAAATGINFLLGTALFSATFLFSLYCGTIMHYTAFEIGLLFLKGSCIQLVMMPLIGKFSNRIDGRFLVGLGITVATLSLYFNTRLTDESDFWGLWRPIFIRSCGLGFVFVPLSVLALSNLPPKQRGNGAGLFNLTRELGGSFGTAWMSSALGRAQVHAYSSMGEHISIYSEATRARLQAMTAGIGSRLTYVEPGVLQLLQYRLSMQSLIKGFNHCFWQVTIVFALSLVLVFRLAKPGKVQEKIHDAH